MQGGCSCFPDVTAFSGGGRWREFPRGTTQLSSCSWKTGRGLLAVAAVCFLCMLQLSTMHVRIARQHKSAGQALKRSTAAVSLGLQRFLQTVLLTTALTFIRKGKINTMNCTRELPHHLCLLAATAYWVLQSPSPLLAAFIFFSSFCSCSSAARISFGFWYCRTERNALSNPVLPLLQADKLVPGATSAAGALLPREAFLLAAASKACLKRWCYQARDNCQDLESLLQYK